MPLPLAIPIAAGVISAGAGIIGARGRKRRNRRAIDRAYGIEKENLSTRQGDLRDSTVENLNARGILRGGAGSSTAAPTAPVASTRKGWRGAVDNHIANAYHAQAVDVHAAAGSGRIAGASNTLAGQEQGHMNDAFLTEQQDLMNERNDAQQQNSDTARQETIGAIAGGLTAGLNIAGAYGISPMDPTAALKSGGPLSGGPMAGSSSVTGPLGTSGQWHGADPVFDFNVQRSR